MTPSCFKFFFFFNLLFYVIFFNPGNNNLDLIKSYNTYNDLEREFQRNKFLPIRSRTSQARRIFFR